MFVILCLSAFNFAAVSPHFFTQEMASQAPVPACSDAELVQAKAAFENLGSLLKNRPNGLLLLSKYGMEGKVGKVWGKSGNRGESVGK